MAKKKRVRVTVLEAVDNLSHLADLDVEKSEWLDPAKVQENQDAIRETFVTLTYYLQHLYQKEREELNNPQTQKGLQAMMQLAGEAVEKVGRYTQLFKGAHAREEAIPEFKQLQHFYLSKVFSKVKKEKAEEGWEKEGLEQEHRALKDLESVQQDLEYELFYISKEDGTPFFSPELLRHIRMVGSFDESLISKDQDDLFRRMEVILDRDLHVSAQEILQEGSNLIDSFCKEAFHHKEHEGPQCLIKAMMALMLAANPKNLLHNTQGKSCIDYFIDFETSLRQGLESSDYEKWRTSTTLNPFKTISLKLIHFFCNAFFLRSGSRHAIISFVRDFVEKRASELPTIWGTLASIENAIRTELHSHPNGPLMKILKLFRQNQEKGGFDPILQHNPPGQIFTISSESMHTSVIHLPCPVHQDFIDRVTVVPEFKGYLRSLGNQRHLYIDLQDRTSWKEYTRSMAIEELSKTGEFVDVLRVIALDKEIDQTVVDFVRNQFFDAKPVLTRKENLDFTEIVHFFQILKMIDSEKPSVISFSCKDGVDTGAAVVAAFYGFSRMLSTSKPWSEEDKDFFLLAFFGPALLVRHRSIASPIFQRTLSALDYFDHVLQEKRDKILKACAALFPELPIAQVKVA